jgi:hypothetical protein
MLWAFSTAFIGLMAAPVLWFVLFSNHVAIHEFECILLAPGVALAIAWCALHLLEYSANAVPGRIPLRYWAVAFIGPLVLMLPLLMLFHQTVQIRMGLSPTAKVVEPDEFVRLGRAICAQTPPESVVLSPEMHLVPVYYSWRHMEGGVTDDHDLERVMPIIHGKFPGLPVYLALFAKDRNRFPIALGSYPSLNTESMIIVRLSG